jgi:hypothetical protein
VAALLLGASGGAEGGFVAACRRPNDPAFHIHDSRASRSHNDVGTHGRHDRQASPDQVIEASLHDIDLSSTAHPANPNHTFAPANDTLEPCLQTPAVRRVVVSRW